jgi:Fic family protein
VLFIFGQANSAKEAVLQTLTQDVVKTSEIEGEQLDATQVRSSLARRLGIDIGALPPTDRNVEGIVEVMLDATRNYQARSPPSAFSAGMRLCSPPGAAA